MFRVDPTFIIIDRFDPLLKLPDPPIISTYKLNPLNFTGTTILSAMKSIVNPNTKVVYKKNTDKEYFKSNTFNYTIVVVGEPPYADFFHIQK